MFEPSLQIVIPSTLELKPHGPGHQLLSVRLESIEQRNILLVALERLADALRVYVLPTPDPE